VDELQETDRRIREWRALVGRQKTRIAELQRGGHNAAGSITLLRGLEASLHALRHERALTVRKLERRKLSQRALS
jgi:hypothetical protein